MSNSSASETSTILVEVLTNQVCRNPTFCVSALIFYELQSIGRKVAFNAVARQPFPNLAATLETQLEHIWGLGGLLGCFLLGRILHELFQKSSCLLMEHGSGYKADRELARLRSAASRGGFRLMKTLILNFWNVVGA